MADETVRAADLRSAEAPGLQGAWSDVAGRSVLFLKAVSDRIEENAWISCMSESLSGYAEEELRILSDARNTTEVGNSHLYADTVELLLAHGIKRMKLALVTPDAGRKILLQLLQSIARDKGIDVDVGVYQSVDDAKRWISNQTAA